MDRRKAEALAVALLAEFGVDHDGWRFAWNRRKASYGLCRYDCRQLELSGPLVDVNDVHVIEDTIRHEIAHILAGPGVGHGRAWKRQCAVTGAIPRACTVGRGVRARWIGLCPTEGCGVRLERHRLNAAARSGACPDCCRTVGGYDHRFRLLWIDTHARHRPGEPHTGIWLQSEVPTGVAPSSARRRR